MELNPILARELRRRWRGYAGFAPILGYLVLVAATLSIQYAGATAGRGLAPRHAAGLGRDMFAWLAWEQMLACILIPPAISATAISSDRESGMLEALQLSWLRPPAVVWGKFGAAMAGTMLMLLTTLPLQGWCLQLGGIDPASIGLMLLLQVTTAGFWCAASLLCSAWQPRGAAALRSSIGIVVLWGVVSGLCAIFYRPYAALAAGFPWWRAEAMRLVLLTSPLQALITLLPGAAGGLALQPSSWRLTVLCQCGAIPLMLLLAASALRRPLVSNPWIDRRRNPGPSAPHSAGIWKVPVERLWHFQNPVLRHELTSKFRMRQAPLVVIVIEAMLGLAVVAAYGHTLWLAVFHPFYRHMIWSISLAIGFLVVTIASVVMGAASVTREKEQGTWENLSLSLLSMRQILAAKAWAAVLACFLFSVPFWPLLLSCLHPGGQRGIGVPSVQAAADLLVVGGVAWCCATAGVMCSCLLRRTATAAGCCLGALFCCLIAPLPWVLMEPPHDLIRWLHPLSALTAIANSTGAKAIAIGMAYLTLMACLGALFLTLAGVFARCVRPVGSGPRARGSRSDQ